MKKNRTSWVIEIRSNDKSNKLYKINKLEDLITGKMEKAIQRII
ncbi:MAG: hypothetical protein ACLUD1_02790 [Clostridia bacterium]